MNQERLDAAAKILGYELLVVWLFFGVWLFMADAFGQQASLRVSEYGWLAYWGFVIPFFVSFMFLDLRVEVPFIAIFVGLLLSGFYFEWFEVPSYFTLVLATIMVVGAVFGALISKAESAEPGFVRFFADHYAEVLIVFLILFAIWGFFIASWDSVHKPL